jgi:hypothetical protein
MKGRDDLEDLGINRIILTWILKKQNVRVWAGSTQSSRVL